MEFWFTLLIAWIIVVGIILFFAPIIIIYQLSKINHTLNKIGYYSEVQHDELIEAITKKERKDTQNFENPEK